MRRKKNKCIPPVPELWLFSLDSANGGFVSVLTVKCSSEEYLEDYKLRAVFFFTERRRVTLIIGIE